MRWRPAAVGLAAILLGVGAGVGIKALRGANERPAGPALTLHATAEQWRTDEVDRAIAVALHNDGPVPVRLSRVELVLPSFTGGPPSVEDVLLPATGLRVDVSIPYGTGKCPDVNATAPVAAPAEAIVDARLDSGGPTTRMRLSLPYPNVLLNRILRDECVQQRLNRSVVLSFGPWRPRPDGVLDGTLILTAGPDRNADVSLVELSGSIHTDVKPVGDAARSPLITLPATAASVQLPVTANASRCDPHAIAEAKKPFEFPAFLSVGGAPKLATTVPITETDRLALDRMLHIRCKLGLPAG
jgi:hypothetical protein